MADFLGVQSDGDETFFRAKSANLGAWTCAGSRLRVWGRNRSARTLTKNARVITNAYHIDELTKLVKGTGAEVVGLKFRWDRRLVRRIERLKDGATILLVFDDPDKKPSGELILRRI